MIVLCSRKFKKKPRFVLIRTSLKLNWVSKVSTQKVGLGNHRTYMPLFVLLHRTNQGLDRHGPLIFPSRSLCPYSITTEESRSDGAHGGQQQQQQHPRIKNIPLPNPLFSFLYLTHGNHRPRLLFACGGQSQHPAPGEMFQLPSSKLYDDEKS